MYSILSGGLAALPYSQGGHSRSINAENPYGRKGEAAMESGPLGPGRKGRPCLADLAPGSVTTLADIEGPATITHLWFTVADRTTPDQPYVLRDLVLRIYWDQEDSPSVDCPLGDFFCSGFGQACRVDSIPIVVAPTRGFNCYFPMPFARRARIELVNQHANTIPAFFYQVDYQLWDRPLPESVQYFHAQWRRERLTERGRDYRLLDGVSGPGRYVGTYLALTTLERAWWGEGEFKFYLDGDQSYPTICSTGAEDYFGGGWSFARQAGGGTEETNFCSPFFGYPFHSRRNREQSPYYIDDCPTMRGLYRWHIPDPICFDEDLRVTWQQIGSDLRGAFERTDDVSTVAYWYQREPHSPFPALPPAQDRWPR
jgi:hypothetical protein